MANTSNEDRERLIEAVFRRGTPIKVAANCLGLKYHKASLILRQFKTEDRCHRLTKGGSKAKYGPEFNQAIKQLISTKSTITLGECQGYFRDRTNQFNNKASITTIDRIVNAEGFTVKKLRTVTIERNTPSTC